MDNVIDNSSTRNLTSFQEIELRIFEISEKYSLDSADNTAYAARQSAAQSSTCSGHATTILSSKKHL